MAGFAVEGGCSLQGGDGGDLNQQLRVLRYQRLSGWGGMLPSSQGCISSSTFTWQLQS